MSSTDQPSTNALVNVTAGIHAAASPSTPNLGSYGEPGNLVGRTLRTVLLLVGSCVLFVGALSTAAVVITSKAVGTASPDSSEARDTTATPKKPLSI